MNKTLFPSCIPITKKYEHYSGSNPSLLTAGLPSESKIISHSIQPTAIEKNDHSLNQNQATDAQPIMFTSEIDNSTQCTSASETYLNLSRQDINDVLTALHTLAQYVNYDVNIRKQDRMSSMNDDDESDYSTIVCNSLSSSIRANNSSYYHHQPRHLLQHHRRCALSSNLHLCHHHIKHHRNSTNDFSNISGYPSYSSNAMFHTSPSCSIHHRSLQYPSIKPNISSHIHDQLISIDPCEPFSNIHILPQQAHQLQVLENSPFHTEDVLRLSCKPISNSTKIDAATQWSSQELMSSSPGTDLPKSIQCHDEQENTQIDLIRTHSSTLTELSQSTAAIVMNKSEISISKISLLNDLFLHQQNSTRTEIEELLTKLDPPICQCSTINDTSLSLINKKRRKSSSIQRTSKRSHI